MAKFLTTNGIVHYLEEAIKTADHYLILFTPFLKMPVKLRQRLVSKLENPNFFLIIVCRQTDLKAEEKKWLVSFPNVILEFNEALHAKCFFNEKLALVSSLNIYEHSIYKNIEFGALFTREHDQANFTDLENECFQLLGADVHKLIANQKAYLLALDLIEQKYMRKSVGDIKSVVDKMVLERHKPFDFWVSGKGCTISVKGRKLFVIFSEKMQDEIQQGVSFDTLKYYPLEQFFSSVDKEFEDDNGNKLFFLITKEEWTQAQLVRERQLSKARSTATASTDLSLEEVLASLG